MRKIVFGLGLAAAALGSKPYGASSCEIKCAPMFTQCLLDAGQSAEVPDPRVEHECRRYTQANCIHPCERGQ